MSSRPGQGFGRPLRPRPTRELAPRPWLDPSWWVEIELPALEAVPEPTA